VLSSSVIADEVMMPLKNVTPLSPEIPRQITPPLKRLTLDTFTGIVTRKSCTDANLQAVSPTSCVEKRIIIDKNSAAENVQECNKVSGQYDMAKFTLKSDSTLDDEILIATGVDAISRESATGTLVMINRPDKEAKFTIAVCERYNIPVRIMFSDYDKFERQMSSFNDGQGAKVTGNFVREPAEDDEQYTYYIFDPQVDALEAEKANTSKIKTNTTF
jgi:hypothetical protein